MIKVSYAFKKDAKGERHGCAAERLLAANRPLMSRPQFFGSTDFSQQSHRSLILPPSLISSHMSHLLSNEGPTFKPSTSSDPNSHKLEVTDKPAVNLAPQMAPFNSVMPRANTLVTPIMTKPDAANEFKFPQPQSNLHSASQHIAFSGLPPLPSVGFHIPGAASLPPLPPGQAPQHLGTTGLPPLPTGLPPLLPGFPQLPPGTLQLTTGLPPLPPGMQLPTGLPPLPQGPPPLPHGLPPMSPGMPPMPFGLPNMPSGIPPFLPQHQGFHSKELPPMPPGMPPMPPGMPPIPIALPPGLPPGLPPFPPGIEMLGTQNAKVVPPPEFIQEASSVSTSKRTTRGKK